VRHEAGRREGVARRGLRAPGGGDGRGGEDGLDVGRGEAIDQRVVLSGEEALRPVLEQALDLRRLLPLRNALVWRGRTGSGRSVAAPADDGLLEPQLAVGLLVELVLVCVSRHQPVDAHQLGLSDAVAARLRLDRETREGAR